MSTQWFRVTFAQNAFTRLLSARDLRVADLDVSQGVDAMADFYENYGAQHTAGGGEDSLHVTWDATETSADFAIARRMIRSGSFPNGDPPNGAERVARELTLRFVFSAAPWHSSGSALYTDAEVVRELEATRLATAAALVDVRLEFVEI